MTYLSLACVDSALPGPHFATLRRKLR
jgi:hypothetical protein